MVKAVLYTLWGIGIYIAIPATIGFCASYFLKNPKKQVPVAVTVFIISFVLEYGVLMYANRHPEIHCYVEDIPVETMSEITEVLVEEHKITLTSGDKFFIPIGYTIRSISNDGYWYRIRLFPFSNDIDYFLYKNELS